MSHKRDFTQGPITKALLTLAIPIVFANIFNTIYQLTDTFWVGQLGENAVAAVSFSFPILFMIFSLGAGFAAAGSILIAQYKGKKDQKNINFTTSQTLSLLFLIAVVLSIVGSFGSQFFLEAMGAEPAIMDDATFYLRIAFIGTIFMFVFFVYQSVMRGVGDVKTPLYIVISTVILNFILDPLFIFGYGPIPALGVSGAAAATLITEGLSALIGVILLVRGRHGVKISFKHLIPDLKFIKKSFLLGFPTSIEHSTRSIGMVIMTVFVASFGTTIVASYGLATRILSFVIIPAIGLAMSTSTIVGQNIGAGKPNRAQKTLGKSMLIGFSSLSIIGVLLFIFAPHVVAAFIPGAPNVINEASTFIRIMSLSFGFIGIQMAMIGTLRGSGNTKSAMTISLVSLVVQLGVAGLAVFYFNLDHIGIWIAYPISNIIGACFAFYFIAKGDWKHKQIT